MAFISDNFSPVGGQGRKGKAPSIWSYFTDTDTLEDIQAANYFNEIASLVSAGDMIFFNTYADDPPWWGLLNVVSSQDQPPLVVIDNISFTILGEQGVQVQGYLWIKEAAHPNQFFISDLDGNFNYVLDGGLAEPAVKAYSEKPYQHTLGAGEFSVIGGGLRCPQLLIQESGNAFDTIFNPPVGLTANIVYQLPPNDGNPGDKLTTDGNGNLTWAP